MTNIELPKRRLFRILGAAPTLADSDLLSFHRYENPIGRHADCHPMPIKPNFFVVGAHKAGTTSFCELLNAHPSVFVCSPKEPSFFAHPKRRARGVSWYESLFASARYAAAAGDGSTHYSQCGIYPEAAGRIKAYSPNARIFYLVRHPLRRIESAWVQYRGQGRTDVSGNFDTAVRTAPQLIDASRYQRQLAQYQDLFAEISVVFFEDFIADPAATVSRAYSFLQVDDTFVPPNADQPRNPSAGKREPRRQFRKISRMLGYHEFRVMKRIQRSRLASTVSGRAFFDRVLTRPIVRPRLDGPTKRWVLDQLGDDTRRFLEDHGKSSGYWAIDRTGPAH